MKGNVDKKEKIQKLLKKYKYLVYITIGIISCILLIVIMMLPDFLVKHPNLYNLGMGIGCGALSTVIVTIILLALLPDDQDINSEIEEWGLEKIYKERSDTKITKMNFPKKQLDFVAFGLHHFRDENSNFKHITKRLTKKGLIIRIITINPSSIYLKEYQRQENRNDIVQDIEELIRWVKQISEQSNSPKTKGSVELRLYNSLPLNFYCRADDKVYVGPYIPGEASSDTITYQFDVTGKIGEDYANFFEKLWNNETNIKLFGTEYALFGMKQKDSIEALLKYFCEKIRLGQEKPVIGVVAIFKNQLRRTFFSVNKPNEERHVCHEKMEGSVGELINKNNDSRRITLLFSDYENKMCFIYVHANRNTYIEKISYNIEKMKDDDTVAILAVPLFRNDSLVGVLTFDFAELLLVYKNITDKLSNIPDNTKITDKNLTKPLKSLFELADQCGKIVTNMIGHEMETEYSKLFEEEWSYNAVSK